MRTVPKSRSWCANTPDDLLTLLSNFAIVPSRKRAVADAMRELYANALQHGSPPIMITLSISVTDILVTVEDAGGTLDPELVSRACETKALEVQFDTPGAGIGLARSVLSADSAEVAVAPDRKTQLTLRWNLLSS